MRDKIADYKQLLKLRLSGLVVFSAVLGYMYAADDIDYLKISLLAIGGFLVTGSSNGFNQVMERETDKLMDRTANRPLAKERMSVKEGLILSSVLGIIGIGVLGIFMNPLTGLLSFLALVSYTVIYTPSKKHTPFAVFIGAFPGALPPMLGYVAFTGRIDLDALLLFFIQFIWQFPHFWAIAWVLDDDYKKAGFNMLPSIGGRNKSSAFQTAVYTISLIPLGLLAYYFQRVNLVATLVITLAAVFFALQSLKLLRDCTISSAKQLMFGSFIYLPVVQISMVCGKI